MGFWDQVGKVVVNASKVLPPCHVCGEPGAQVCHECHRVGCHKHSYTNIATFKSVCSSCMGVHFKFANDDLRKSAANDWPYPEAPWDILGVRPDATEDEVREAQRRRSREVHPDKHGGDDTQQRAVNRAAEEMLRRAA